MEGKEWKRYPRSNLFYYYLFFRLQYTQTNNWNGTDALFDELNSRFAGSSLHVRYVYIRLHVRLLITLHTFTFYYSWRCKRLNTNSKFVELELLRNEISFPVDIVLVLVDLFFVYINVIDIYLYRLLANGLSRTWKGSRRIDLDIEERSTLSVYLLTRLIGTRSNLQKHR